MFRDIVRFLWSRTTTNAAFLGIRLAQFLDDRDLQQLADYYESVLRGREQERKLTETERNLKCT